MTSGQRRGVRHAIWWMAVAGTAMLGTVAAAAQNCVLPREEAAAQTRVLISELVVAALTCDSRKRYNAFARRFRPELVAHGTELRLYFARAHGDSGRRHLDEFVTLLANVASMRSIQTRQDYCVRTAELFDRVLATEPGELSVLAAELPFANTHGMEPCRASMTVLAVPRRKPTPSAGTASGTSKGAEPPV